MCRTPFCGVGSSLTFLWSWGLNAETIASYADTTLKAYMELTSSVPSSWMVTRIIELAEKIPALIQGGKKVEIRSELQLLTGFLGYAKGLKGIGSALTASTTLKDAFVGECLYYVALGESTLSEELLLPDGRAYCHQHRTHVCFAIMDTFESSNNGC